LITGRSCVWNSSWDSIWMFWTNSNDAICESHGLMLPLNNFSRCCRDNRFFLRDSVLIL
jgi:hypothetical protein